MKVAVLTAVKTGGTTESMVLRITVLKSREYGTSFCFVHIEIGGKHKDIILYLLLVLFRGAEGVWWMPTTPQGRERVAGSCVALGKALKPHKSGIIAVQI
jgi:hypothetical protein